MTPEHAIEIDCLTACIAEYDNRPVASLIEDLTQRFELVLETYLDVLLRNLLRGRGAFLGGKHYWILHISFEDTIHLGRERRRKQKRLALLRRLLQNRRHVVYESHVEHAVGFVEYDDFAPNKGQQTLA